MLDSYSGLKSAISTWLHRADLDGSIPDFITLAESRINTDVDSRHQDTTVSMAASKFVTLPTDFMNIRKLALATDPKQVLNYMTPDQLAARYTLSSAARPISYTITGDHLELAPAPDGAYTLDMTYQARLTPLSDSATSNWALSNFPALYLYGALSETAPFLKDDQRMQVWEARYKDAVNNANLQDWFSGSTPRVRSL